jgi:hypothetical protein
VRGNVVVNGGLYVVKYKKAVQKDNLVLGKGARRAAGARVVLRPNKHAMGRANLAVFNWEKKPAVAVDLGGVLKPGDAFRLLDPRDFFGKPVFTGRYAGKPVRVPVKGEFAAFVLLKGTGKDK